MFERHEIVKAVKVQKGSKPKLSVVTSESISLLMKKGEKTGTVKTHVKLNDNLKMPVKKGEEVGSLTISNGKKTVVTSPLLASENIDSASWWSLMKRTVGSMVKSPQ
jgi:D-alanyl-D-alanine carboxypeptidase (penicillin-binding protein 5/6)